MVQILVHNVLSAYVIYVITIIYIIIVILLLSSLLSSEIPLLKELAVILETRQTQKTLKTNKQKTHNVLPNIIKHPKCVNLNAMMTCYYITSMKKEFQVNELDLTK